MNSSMTGIRYGRIAIITDKGDYLQSEEETIHDYLPTTKLYRNMARVFADNRKQVLAEVLKLVDKLNEDNVTDIAFTCCKKAKNSQFQMEVTWTSK